MKNIPLGKYDYKQHLTEAGDLIKTKQARENGTRCFVHEAHDCESGSLNTLFGAVNHGCTA